MPTLLIWHGYKFRFYSSDRPEPAHVHIVRDRAVAKVWLGNMEIAFTRGYSDREIAEFLAKIAESRDEWMEKWNGFFGL
jgi:hypothetical protein